MLFSILSCHWFTLIYWTIHYNILSVVRLSEWQLCWMLLHTEVKLPEFQKCFLTLVLLAWIVFYNYALICALLFVKRYCFLFWFVIDQEARQSYHYGASPRRAPGGQAPWWWWRPPAPTPEAAPPAAASTLLPSGAREGKEKDEQKARCMVELKSRKVLIKLIMLPHQRSWTGNIFLAMFECCFLKIRWRALRREFDYNGASWGVRNPPCMASSIHLKDILDIFLLSVLSYTKIETSLMDITIRIGCLRI